MQGSFLVSPSRQHNPKNDNLVLNFLVMITQKDDRVEVIENESGFEHLPKTRFRGWIGEENPIIIPYTGYEDVFFYENETEFQKKHRAEFQRDPQLPKVYKSRQEALDAIEAQKKGMSSFNEEYFYELVPFRSNK
jgi:hypothetical protein